MVVLTGAGMGLFMWLSESQHLPLLGFLAPDIVTAILNGHQPVGLTANKLANASRLPNGWAEQRQVLGFG